MLWTDPRTWSFWVWCLHVLAALYVGGFLWFFFMFRAEEKRAMAGDPRAVRRYNHRLRGFPNALYAKMLGKRAIVVPADPKTSRWAEGSGEVHQ